MIEEKWMSGRGGTEITPHECGRWWWPRAAILATSHEFMHVNSFPSPMWPPRLLLFYLFVNLDSVLHSLHRNATLCNVKVPQSWIYSNIDRKSELIWYILPLIFIMNFTVANKLLATVFKLALCFIHIHYSVSW